MNDESLAKMAARVSFKLTETCQKCGLYQYSDCPKISGRGVLNKSTELILIGEAPGLTESRENKVFCGKAGRKLEEMLKPYRDSGVVMYITNAVKCYPPLSTKFPEKAFRVPKQYERDLCREYLIEELEKVDASKVVIMTLGNTALRAIYPPDRKIEPISMELGIFREVKIGNETYNVLPNYHPSYILRSYNMKKDFIRVMDIFMESRRSLKEN